MLPFGVLGVFLVGDAQVQVSEIEALLGSLKEIASSFISCLFLIAVLESILRSISAVINVISLRRSNLNKKKEIAKKIGRSVKDIRTDIQDDGRLNYSAGEDVEQMQDVLEHAVEELLEDNS
jgi:vacuolar-type H+-ATPase subunit I/STV1